jgi:hypothetical protein
MTGRWLLAVAGAAVGKMHSETLRTRHAVEDQLVARVLDSERAPPAETSDYRPPGQLFYAAPHCVPT